MRSNGHSEPSKAQPILLTHLITSTNTTRLSCVKGAGALTARPSSRSVSRVCVTKVSHAAANEGKGMIFDTRRSFWITPIDCSTTTFDSSHDDESSAGLTSSVAGAATSGNGGGVTGFACTCGESLSSSGKVTFHTHSSHVLRLSVAPYCCSVLNNVCIAPSAPWPGVRAHAQNLQQVVHPECAIRRLVARLALLGLYRIRDPPEEAFSGRQRDILVRLPRELRLPSVLMQSHRYSRESAARPSHLWVIHWNAILINAE